jgi:hypothetical protein
MEPTPSEVAGFDTLQKASQWAGLSESEVATLLLELGSPASFREVASIPLDTYSTAINAVRVDGPPAGDGACPQIALTPRLIGMAQLFYRACLATTAAPGAPVASTAIALPSSRPKMSSLVDPTIDSEILVLTKSHVEMLFSDYRKARGEYPAPDIEPTEEQLSAVNQLINTKCVPYVDFAIFGPFGRRLLKKLTLTCHVFHAPDGSWKRQELPGPPDFDSWWKSWLVLKCTFLLLQAIRPERLEQYGEHLRSLLNTYGTECWFLIYQADTRMRSEHFERIRRRLQIDHDANINQHEFDPIRPWDGVFAAAVKDKDFWDSEVREKAILYLAKVTNYRDIANDGTAQPSRGLPHKGQGQFAKGQGHQGQGSKRKHSGHQAREPFHKGANPKGKGYGNDTCNNWNNNKCPLDPCPSGRAHVCSKCYGAHKRDQCTNKGKGGKDKGGRGGRK